MAQRNVMVRLASSDLCRLSAPRPAANTKNNFVVVWNSDQIFKKSEKRATSFAREVALLLCPIKFLLKVGNST
jgi:hypothetical protein